MISINGLQFYEYVQSEEWKILIGLLKHSKEFRNNFWFTLHARFIELSEFSKTFDEELLHIESGVIIADDFPFKILSCINAK